MYEKSTMIKLTAKVGVADLYLFPVLNRAYSYSELIRYLQENRFEACLGNVLIYYLYEYWKLQEVELPDDQGYIVGLADKSKLQFKKFKCETILYEFPVIVTLRDGRKILHSSCFSESDKINNFSTCYVICTKLKEDQ